MNPFEQSFRALINKGFTICQLSFLFPQPRGGMAMESIASIKLRPKNTVKIYMEAAAKDHPNKTQNHNIKIFCFNIQ